MSKTSVAMGNVFPMQVSWIFHDDHNPHLMHTFRKEKGDGFCVSYTSGLMCSVQLANILLISTAFHSIEHYTSFNESLSCYLMNIQITFEITRWKEKQVKYQYPLG